MAEEHLQDVLSKITASKEVKIVVRDLFYRLQDKILAQVRQKYINQAVKKPKKAALKREEAKSPTGRQPAPVSKEENLAETRQKEEEAKEFLKRLKKEQKERERRQHERDEEEKQKRIEEDRLLDRRKQEELLRAEEEKIRRLKELKEKSSKRKKEIKNLIDLGNQEFKKVISSKPLHEKIEEKYFSNILMPELERHKMELARKREMFQPINRSAILEHAKKHDQIIEDHEQQKRNQSEENNYDMARLRSKYTIAYLEEKKKKKQEIDKEMIEKKNLMEKKKQYAELVSEMYQPTIDPAKQLELKLIKEKLKEAGYIKKKSAKSLSAKEAASDGEKPPIIKKKWGKNLMVPTPPIKREPVVVDWLLDQRKIREKQKSAGKFEESGWEEGVTVDDLKKNIENIEKQVRRKEMKLQVSNPPNIRGIEETGNISDLLISSIKGKLAILES